MKTFVIGDVHGHHERLQLLLNKARIAWRRDAMPLDMSTGEEVEIVQLGDLIHAGRETHIRDLITMELAIQYRMTLLWGNHDFAIMSPDLHGFRGYDPLYPEALEVFNAVTRHYALSRHGYLLTHAGLHPAYLPDYVSGSKDIANLIHDNSATGHPVVTDIGRLRGGWAEQGGVLWRDDREDLVDVPQVYGHTKGLIRVHGGRRYCIDTGSPTNGSLVGMWLPSRKLVAVGDDAELHETTPFVLSGD